MLQQQLLQPGAAYRAMPAGPCAPHGWGRAPAAGWVGWQENMGQLLMRCLVEAEVVLLLLGARGGCGLPGPVLHAAS